MVMTAKQDHEIANEIEFFKVWARFPQLITTEAMDKDRLRFDLMAP